MINHFSTDQMHSYLQAFVDVGFAFTIVTVMSECSVGELSQMLPANDFRFVSNYVVFHSILQE